MVIHVTEEEREEKEEKGEIEEDEKQRWKWSGTSLRQTPLGTLLHASYI